jgi:tetratricopeptide (TPR) repeat protein
MTSPPAAGAYPGNPALSAEVREKILSTFRHTLSMYTAGKYNDCLIGCEFILKMDPRFGPARRLLEKARNPNADVDMAELEMAAEPAAAAPDGTPPGEARRLLAEAVASLDGRDFETAIERARQVIAAQPGNPEALDILEKASGAKAAQPLFDAVHRRADAALGEDHPEDARREVERMRLLDAGNPAIPLLERDIEAATTANPASAAGPPPSEDIFAAGASEPHIGFGHEQSGPSAMSDGAPDVLQLGALSLDAGETPPPSFGSPGDTGSLEPVPPPLFTPAGPSEEEQGSEREIEALVKQGDEAQARGNRHQAIEIWSRVFLIDINNGEAVTRIEKARQEMAEETRRLAEYLKSGRESFEAGGRDAARQAFLQVLALDPEEPTARFYLEKIQEGESAAPAAAKTAAPARAAVQPTPSPSAAIAVPPSRGRLSLLDPKVLGVVGAFLVMTVVGVYFVLSSGGKAAAPVSKTVAPGSIEHARELLGNARIAEARSELQRIGGDSDEYAEAQKMLADLGKGGAGEAPRARSAGAPQAAQRPKVSSLSQNDPARLRAAAEKALQERRYIEAFKNFNLAAAAFRDDPTFTQGMGAAADKVTALTPAVKLYNEGEYDTAIPILWRIYQEDHENQDARSYLFRAYFNQGVTQLQNGLYLKAAKNFQEALSLQPNDVEAARHRKFADHYQKGDLDLMGRIYARHLSQRP